MSMMDKAIAPMLAEPAEGPFDSSEYFFEVKWDGTRALAFVGGKTRLQNRRFVDITARYPDIVINIKGSEAILDGEIIVMHKGIPDFRMLARREHIIDPLKIKYLSQQLPASYIVFDILYHDGIDLTGKPLFERKKILDEVLFESDSVLRCDYISGDGEKYYRAVVERGLEGVMAKRMDSPYLTGRRSRYWLKIKKMRTLELIICGITKGEGWREPYFGALLLGGYMGGKLTYMGRVGTGFEASDLEMLMEEFRGLESKCPFEEIPEVDAEVKTWLVPRLVCMVEFNEITHDKRLRAPRYKGLRRDKAPEECVI